MDALVRRVIEESVPASPITRSYAVASEVLRVHFSSARLAELLGNSFAVAVHDDTPADAAWNVVVAAGGDGRSLSGLVPRERGGAMRFAVYPESYVLWMGFRGATLYAVDLPRRRALCWIAAESDIPAWEQSRPLLPILQIMLDATPWLAVHSAAISHSSRAALLVGPSRAGKSSLALAAMREGWCFAGDDYVLLRTDATPAIAPLFATARLRDDMMPHFRELETARRGISEETGERRHELIFGPKPAGGGTGAVDLAAGVLLDRRGADGPAFSPVSRTALAATIAANLALATPGYHEARVAKLLRALSHMNVRRFDPGSDFRPALEALAQAMA